MIRKSTLLSSCFAGIGIAAFVGTFAIAQPTKDAKPGAQPEMKLPPGWTSEDMEACAMAATPGKMHEFLAEGVGTWNGKSTMWMGPGADPVNSECTSTLTSIMDGRFVKCEMTGDIPGMPGPFNGAGVYGFDNVSQKFVSAWIDNCSTGIMNGTGELSDEGKTLTWKYTANCPITKKPTTMREVEKITGDNTRTMEMYSIDPKSGKEYKMMSIELTRQ